MASTFSYSPKTSQLTDIWNEANKKSKLSEFWKDANKPSNFGLGIEKENTQFTKTAKTSQKTTAQNGLRGVKNGKGIDDTLEAGIKETVPE